MISDTLFEVDAEIREYLAAGADYGAEINKQIEAVLASMDALRHTLDALRPE